MENNKLYFRRNQDEEHCYTLGELLHNAWDEGLDEVELYEAVPDDNNPTYIYCTYYGECGDRSECNKANCSCYKPQGGWQPQKCKYRGALYTEGENKTFKTRPLCTK